MINICRPNELRNNTLNSTGVVFLEAKVKEEDLFTKGAKSFLIIEENLNIFPDIALILH